MQPNRGQHDLGERSPQKWQHDKLVKFIAAVVWLVEALTLRHDQMPQIVKQGCDNDFRAFAGLLSQGGALQGMLQL